MHIHALSIVDRVYVLFFILFASRCASKLHAVSHAFKRLFNFERSTCRLVASAESSGSCNGQQPKKPSFCFRQYDVICMYVLPSRFEVASSPNFDMKRKDSLFNFDFLLKLRISFFRRFLARKVSTDLRQSPQRSSFFAPPSPVRKLRIVRLQT